MNEIHVIKNMPFAEPRVLAELVDYQNGRVVSRTLAQTGETRRVIFFEKHDKLEQRIKSAYRTVNVLKRHSLEGTFGNGDTHGSREGGVFP